MTPGRKLVSSGRIASIASRAASGSSSRAGRIAGHGAWCTAVGIALALGATGCVTRLDMTAAYDPDRAATTIPYSGVRGARQFPDYEAIGPSILTGADPFAAPKGAKGPKPKGGSK